MCAARSRWLIRCLLAFCSTSVLIPGDGLIAADDPEYLRVEIPLPGGLEEVRSPTGRIGVTPDSWIDEYDPFRLRPSQFLPGLRERILPQSGHRFLDDAEISLRPRFYYRNVKGGGVAASEAGALGGSLALESGWLADTLRISLVAHTSQRLQGSGERGGTGLLDGDQQGYSVLGEAFAEFKMDETSLFIGRSRIDTPFINGHDIRMTPNTFEGIGIRTLALAKFQLAVGHLSKIKFRNSTHFVPMSVHAGAPGTDRGVSLLGLRYNFSEDFYLGLVEQYGWDMFNSLYLESDRLFKLTDDLDLRVGAQFTDQRSTGKELLGSFSTQTAGVKAALGYRGLIGAASATTTADGSSVRKPWGGTPSFNSAMVNDFDRAGEDSVRLEASMDFSVLGLDGLAADVSWLYGDTPEHGRAASPDQRELNYTVDFRPPVKSLENFWLRVRYAVIERDSAPGKSTRDREDFRVILNWSSSF